ncbi:uncharacterized protein LOC119669595 [Teleopsis dalmanni]|uniref:uncharacterized protein LOC119669595 n=1 Tax=Teleopsis dalmanni TaxID=139649 RepID=UPI0018CE64AF|nr:uncharacterized protein LOC119669595 [Teleopsis dalmanni]
MFPKRCFYILGVVILVELFIFSIAWYMDSISNPIYPEHLKLDTLVREPTIEQMIEGVDQELPNLPFELYIQNKDKGYGINSTCAQYPNILHIKFHNNFYQEFENLNVTFELFGAYYDNRAAVPDHPVIRVLAMVNQTEEEFPISYCQLWYEDQKEPIIVPITKYFPIWFKNWGTNPNVLYPYLITCVLPRNKLSEVPQSVSIVAEECERATNHLKVIYEPPTRNITKGGFAVCLKNLVFPFVDISARLVEWMEMMRILGAQEVIAYSITVHPNVTKVIDYYKEQGFLRVYPHSYARGEPVFPYILRYIMKHHYLNKVLNELLPYNDCFYRNLYKYDYVACIDLDEVIMPLGNWTSWYDIVEYAEEHKRPGCQTHVSLCFQNIYFPNYEKEGTDLIIPKYFHMLQHVRRVEKHLDVGLGTKCLHNTNYAIMLHHHYCFKWLGCGPLHINSTLAQLQHYRDPVDQRTKNLTVLDDNILRFHKNLFKRSMRVFYELNFL